MRRNAISRGWLAGLLSAALAAGAPAQTTQPQEPAPQPAVSGVFCLLKTTLGDILLELDVEKAPLTVANFVGYVSDGFYDGTIFHRVIKDFMIQGGGYTPDMDRKTRGLKDPIRNEWRNGLKNVRGSISMARLGGQPHSASSQFFINVVDNPRLDAPQPDGAAYAVFGRVAAGMAAVDAIRNTPVGHNAKLGMGPVAPTTPVVIESARLLLEEEARTAAAAIEAGDPAPPVADNEARQAALARIRDAVARAAAAHTPEKELERLIAKVEQETGRKFETTRSGLRHILLKEGSGPQPQPTDTVEVHYTGWLVDGTQFDSSVARNEPFTFDLSGTGVIKGWLEAGKLMKVGEKRKFIIPPELGYGRAGRAPKIPPDATLVFDIELLSIRPPPQP